VPSATLRAPSADVAEHYDSSAEALFRPVEVDELSSLIATGGRAVRDPHRLVHLLTRMRTTVTDSRETVTGLHRHIAQMQEYLGRTGTATTLNPADALRYLDDEQKENLFNRIARDRLKMLRVLVDNAEATRDELVGQLGQVRAAATAMAQRPDLPPAVRADFTRMLAYLPSEVRAVHRSGMLDYPDLPDPAAESAAAAGPAPDAAVAGQAAPVRRTLAGLAPGASPAPLSAAVVEPLYLDPYSGGRTQPGDLSQAGAGAYVDPYAAQAPGVYVDPYGPQAASLPTGAGAAATAEVARRADAGTDLGGLFDEGLDQ
jgi:hypothetical protein